MAIQDIIDCKLITKWKRNNAKNEEIRKPILFDQIRATEDFQKLNENADLQSTINARSFKTLNSYDKKMFLYNHSRNIVVGVGKDNTYNLLTGLISYETLKKVYAGRSFTNKKILNDFSQTATEEEIKAKSYELDEQFKNFKTIRVYVTNYENREQFMLGIREDYDITFGADLEYIKEPEYKNSWETEINEEVEKLKKEEQYSPVLNGILRKDTIFLLDDASELLFWAVKKAGRTRVRVKMEKLGENKKIEKTIESSTEPVSYDDDAFEIDF